MSFPPGTEMFQFPGFASPSYEFRRRSPLREGLPHSEIPGSKPARGSPRLIAACHVLLRLLAPRRPPNALLTLELSYPLRGEKNSAPRKGLFPLPITHPNARASGRRNRQRRKKPSFTMSKIEFGCQRPDVRCQRGGPRPQPKSGVSALCPLIGGGERNRTVDLLLAKQALSQLSYAPDPMPPGPNQRPGPGKLGGPGKT